VGASWPSQFLTQANTEIYAITLEIELFSEEDIPALNNVSDRAAKGKLSRARRLLYAKIDSYTILLYLDSAQNDLYIPF
jgi:hypothetical protein